MFTKGQVDRMLAALQHKSRACQWSDDTYSKVFLPDALHPRVVLESKQELFPKDAKGNYDATVALRVIGASAKEGPLTAGTDFTVDGLPDGLTASATGDGQMIWLNIKGMVSLGADKKFFVTIQPSATSAPNCYVGRQPLTIAHDFVESELATSVSRVVKAEEESRVVCNGNGDVTVVAPQGARISVHNVYGETLVEAHAPAHAVTLQIGGYGHGVYIVSVTSSRGSKSYKIAF